LLLTWPVRYKELKNGRLVKWDGKDIIIPTLDQFLEIVNDGYTVMIDMKHTSFGLESVANVVNKYVGTNEMIVSTYNSTLSGISEEFSNEVSFAYKSYDALDKFNIKRIKKIKEEGFDLILVQVSAKLPGIERLTAMAHDVGLRVITFVDFYTYGRNNFDMQVEAGVDYIISNRLKVFEKGW